MFRDMILRLIFSLSAMLILESVCLAKASDAYLPWDQAIAYQSALRNAAKNAGLKLSAELLNDFDKCSQEDLQITPLAIGIDAAIDRIEARNRELGEELNLRRLEKKAIEGEKGRLLTEKSRLENLMRTSPNDPSLPRLIEDYDRWLADLENRIQIFNSINDATNHRLAVHQQEVAAFNTGELQQYNSRVLAWQATVRELRNRQLQERQRILDHLKSRNPNEPPPELGIPTPKIVAAGTAVTVIVLAEMLSTQNPVNVTRYSSALSNEVVGWARTNPDSAKEIAVQTGEVAVSALTAKLLYRTISNPQLAIALAATAAIPATIDVTAKKMDATNIKAYENTLRVYTRFRSETTSFKASLEKSGHYTPQQIGQLVQAKSDLLIQGLPAPYRERSVLLELGGEYEKVICKMALESVLSKGLSKIPDAKASVSPSPGDNAFLSKYGVRPRGTTKLLQGELGGGFEHHPRPQ